MTIEQTVFIVDDDPVFLETTQGLMSANDLLSESFESAEEFWAGFQPERRGCLLLDVRLPGQGGLELLAEIQERGWLIPTIVMTSYGDIPMAVRAIKMGAVNFIEKPIHDDEKLIEMVREALLIESKSHQARLEVEETNRRLSTLIEREHEILKLIVESLSNREIADELGLSVRTIEHYRLRLMEKMGADSATELVRMMLRHSVATRLHVTPDAVELPVAAN